MNKKEYKLIYDNLLLALAEINLQIQTSRLHLYKGSTTMGLHKKRLTKLYKSFEGITALREKIKLKLKK